MGIGTKKETEREPFPPPTHSNCTGTCTLSWDHRCQDWAVVNTLPSTPFLSLSSFFPSLLIHPLSPPFDSSGSVSVGAASKESLEVRQKDQSQVCWGSPVGPWGWAERWGTDTVVCDKRVSFIANDSHRGDQLLRLRRLTHTSTDPAGLIRRHDLAQKKNGKKTSFTRSERRQADSHIPYSNFQTTFPLMLLHCPQFALLQMWAQMFHPVDKTVDFNMRLKKKEEKKGCCGTVNLNQ